MIRRNHNGSLDIVRGVAAVSVVFFHFSTRIDVLDFFAHGYLAVDLFFVLSGAVVERAYAGKLQSGVLSPATFVKIRTIRLMPLIVIGDAVGMVCELFRPDVLHTIPHMHDSVLAVVLGAALVPMLWHSTLGYTIFPLNGPAWSLFFEVVSNLAFVPVMRSKRSARIALLIAAVALPILLAADVTHGGMGLGPSPDDVLGGFPRVFFSFSVGYLISHLDVRLPRRMGPLPAAALVVAVCAAPVLDDGVNRWFDAVAVVLVFPAIIAGLRSGALPHVATRFSDWCGEMSYPLYAVHYWLVKISAGLIVRTGVGAPLRIALSALVTGVILCVATATYRYVDVPIRSALARRVLDRVRRPVGPAAVGAGADTA